LYCDIHITSGKIPRKELSDAPAPNATNTAGKAQHRIVPLLANNEKKVIF
jgi:hypothetical protein